MIKDLQDYNRPGLHDTAPNSAPLSVRKRRGQTSVDVVHWSFAGMRGFLETGSSCKHFRMAECTPQRISLPGFVSGLERICGCGYGPGGNNLEDVIYRVERINAGYHKAYLNKGSVQAIPGLIDLVPPGVKVKSSAAREAIAFVNSVAGQSSTHFDRDTALLVLLRGSKTIRLAHPSVLNLLPVKTEDNSTILDNVDPFGQDCGLWTEVNMRPSESLLLPKGWIHSVRSTRGTVALSVQVEREHLTGASY